MNNEKKLVVKKDNALINAAYTLTLAEQRLILLSVALAAEDADKLRHTAIHAHEYANRFNVTNATAYEALSDASAQLFERYFTYQQKTEKGAIKHVKSRWVQKVAYLKSEGTIEITFADDVVPLLCELKSRFTAYNLEAVSNLTSTHAIRLYELLIAWLSIGKTPKISTEELRLKLGVAEHEYKQMNDFKKRVLNIALKQINAHSDIQADYEQHKTGRKITAFSFTFEQKQAPNRDPDTVDFINGKPDNDKPKRQKIKKSEAEKMAAPGESWEELYRRLSSKYIIV